MKILHITPSYKPAYIYGGPIYSVSALCEALSLKGHQLDVFTTKANGKSELSVSSYKPYIIEGVNVFYFKRQTKDHSHFSFGLLLSLWRQGKNYQLIHIHSWWNFVAIFSVCICKLRGFQFILSPRGMFSTYSRHRNKNSLKKFIHIFLNKPLLSKANFHATTHAEEKTIIELFPLAKVYTLPNSVRLIDSIIERAEIKSMYRICFLSRIDPKKGLEFVFYALAKTDIPFELSIMGTGDNRYINELKNLAERLNIDKRIVWKGAILGEEKYTSLADADLFILTSYNENFANVVIESLSVGTPVLISKEVGLSDYVAQYNLGWITELSIESIAENIYQSYRDTANRIRINTEAPQLIKEHFSASALGDEYVSMYKNILNHA